MPTDICIDARKWEKYGGYLKRSSETETFYSA